MDWLRPQPPWWKRHRRNFIERGCGTKAPGATARVGACSDHRGLICKSCKSYQRQRDATEAQKAALTLGVQLHVLQVSDERDFADKFGTSVQLSAGALLLGTDALFTSRSEQLAALAVQHMLPTISPFPTFAVAGGLASYGGDITKSWRLAGVYTARILKGEKPVDLPVIQSTKVELAINLKTAKALGIAVSLPLQGRADEVIEYLCLSTRKITASAQVSKRPISHIGW